MLTKNKKNLKEKFYVSFLKGVQKEAKKYDFFDSKVAKRKVIVYKIINKIVTVIAAVMSFLTGLICEVSEIDDDGIILSIILVCLITTAILWGLKFLISFMYNLTCFYNDFSKNGNEDYKKWMSFKKYLKNSHLCLAQFTKKGICTLKDLSISRYELHIQNFHVPERLKYLCESVRSPFMASSRVL